MEALRKVVVKSTKKACESEDFRALDEGVGKDYGVNFEDWNRWTGKTDMGIVYE